MARLARLVVPGLPHHITQRGNRRQAVFFEAADRQCYLQYLAAAAPETGVQIWAYCLMTNHVHLVAVPTQPESFARCFAEVHGRYAKRINARMGWRGHLWQARFGSSVMDNAHTLAAVRYVEQNPVRARLVDQPWDYPWSSARYHVGATDTDPVVRGDDNLRAEVGDWRTFLDEPTDESLMAVIPQETPVCRPLGSEEFIHGLEAQWGVRLTRASRGRPRVRK